MNGVKFTNRKINCIKKVVEKAISESNTYAPGY